ncbi:hypothetical protein OWR28_14115 [Chryseobacterium sp. 1B4]
MKFLVKYEEIGNHPYCAMFYDKDFNKLYLGTLNNGLNIVKLSNFYISKKKLIFPIMFIIPPSLSVRIRSLVKTVQNSGETAL